MDDAQSSRKFEIGLVGAGAISAGAYTSGVVDFLTLALDSWYAAKAAGAREAPPHDVQLRVFSGASAGAITAALATAYLASDQPSITSPEDALKHKGKNKMFDSWVDRIDMSALLGCRDLADKTSPVTSLLDSTVLMDIADQGLDVAPRKERRPYVAPNFELLMTVTNLRGVPYSFKLNAGKQSSHDMSLHADYVHFAISDAPNATAKDKYCMSWSDFGKSNPVKERMKISALASGAFPIGLAPRTLSHDISESADCYSARTWTILTPHTEHPHSCTTNQSIPVNFGPQAGPFQYVYQCVDGGVMNNEPLELARKQLAGSSASNPRDGLLADKAVVMIDPFPSEPTFDPDYKAAPDLLGSAFRLFGALKNQARFKPDELMLAANKDVASRFMIAPSRGESKYPIACGSLGGFGGFLKRDFREHDYFLGRRNAQQFLRSHLVLPEKNALFERWPEAMKEALCVRDKEGQIELKDGMRLLPIIPLLGAAKSDCPKFPWPHFSAQNMDELMGRVEVRLAAISKRLLDQYFHKKPIVGFFMKVVLWQRRSDLMKLVRERVRKDLTAMELSKP
jgi:hypothetical protein